MSASFSLPSFYGQRSWRLPGAAITYSAESEQIVWIEVDAVDARRSAREWPPSPSFALDYGVSETEPSTCIGWQTTRADLAASLLRARALARQTRVRDYRAPHSSVQLAPESNVNEEILEGETADQTDLRNAERLVELHGADLIYIRGWKKWLGFNGVRHEVDATGIAERCAQATARTLLAEAADELRDAVSDLAGASKYDQGEAKKRASTAQKAFDWAAKTQSARGLRDMLDVARSHPSVAASFDAFDRDPWLLNLPNGTLDLRVDSFGLRAHRREDRLTKCAGVAYDPHATCPQWERFLRRAHRDNAEMIRYLQRLVGYSLTALIVEQLLVFSYGEGKNGKSVFHALLRRLLGMYAVHAGRGVLFDSGRQRHPEELTVFWGARLATFPEINKDQVFDEGLVKDLTGGEPMRARRMNENSWEFLPTHKIFLQGNHKPVVRGTDEGIWRRIKLVPWEVIVPPTERDVHLEAKLVDELPGILAWAVRGCLDWQRDGLREPREVTEATTRYREESDVVGPFFDGHCTFAAEERCTRRELREAYEAWARECGAAVVGAKRFAEGLRKRGVSPTSVRTERGPRDGWKGVRLKTMAERDGEVLS